MGRFWSSSSMPLWAFTRQSYNLVIVWRLWKHICRWEWFLSCDFDWDFISGRKPFRWPMVRRLNASSLLGFQYVSSDLLLRQQISSTFRAHRNVSIFRIFTPITHGNILPSYPSVWFPLTPQRKSSWGILPLHQTNTFSQRAQLSSTLYLQSACGKRIRWSRKYQS